MPYVPNTQISLSGANIYQDYSLASNVAAGSSAISVSTSALAPLTAGNFVLIDAYTSQAELRKISSVAGNTVNLTAALKYDHVANDRLLTVTTGVLETIHWGCKGDNSTDDQIPLQEAIYQCAVYGLGFWLDGQNRASHVISQPLVIPSAAKLHALNIKATATFSPAESNNAMLMTQAGNILPFTADPSTDTITCVGHGIPSDNVGVVLQGSNLPGGLTGGKFYYAINRTTDTFQVSTTSGGSAVDITSAGSGGTAWCEVYSTNAKPQFDNCVITGQYTTVTGLNGILMSVQQPGYANALRVDSCDGYGVKMKGQQYVLTNFEAVLSRKALVLDNMSFLWVFGLNAEQCDRALYVDSGGAADCSFYGVHCEMNNGSGYSGATSIAIEQANSSQNMLYAGGHVSMNASGQTVFKSSASAGSSSYRLLDWSTAALGSSGLIFVNDTARGISLDAWDDFRGMLMELVAPLLPSSQSYDDPGPIMYIGNNGKRMAFGSQNNAPASLRLRPGSAQTGDNIRVDDSSGNRVSGFNKESVFFTQRNSAPADGDLVANELTLWFDPTNGASKLMIKAKQADGTVKTGSVSLT